MTRRPRLTARKLISLLRRNGFEIIRIKGSHHFLQHADGRKTVVPVHAGEIIGPGLFAQILRDCDLSDEEFRALL